MSPYNKIRVTLKRARLEQGVSRRAWAKKTGYNRATLINWENGYSIPGVMSLMDWSESLGFELAIVRKDNDENKTGQASRTVGSSEGSAFQDER